ncbi:MAG TPA: SMI1/KNR4 family protein [Oculatellaceae cyanobacterium]|jgi:hypothetical protein
MIDSIQKLKENIISTGSLERHLAGCTEEEILWIEKKYGGIFPESYKDIISLIGYDAGYLIDDNQWFFFVDQILQFLDDSKEANEEGILAGEKVNYFPDKFWPIFTIYYEDIHFIYMNGGVDCPVYIYETSEEPIIKLGWKSVWEWLDEIFRELSSYYRISSSLRRRANYNRINIHST